ncbi:hypothetical protein jhhlp_003421 [Lomentospora prolificans]|uniref:Uncharacterized protein n=1 Tax=Lomentospora prolificans TaxID=41688 RepID=A0A2N3N8W6_9PEZI|nr:hypothetical protein jhhlp_003421 [Lomentospora prolificans]
MQPKTWTLALVLASFASTALAEADRPRIYFPRHVKRQFVNSTSTQQETFPPTTELPLETSTPESEDDTSTNPVDTTESITDTITESLAESSSSSLELIRDTSDILTLSIPTTVVVTTTVPTPVKDSSISSEPTQTTEPAEREGDETSSEATYPSGGEKDASETKTTTTTGSSSSGILLAPTGVVTEDPEETPTDPATETTTSDKVDTPADTTAPPAKSTEEPTEDEPTEEEPAKETTTTSEVVVIPVLPTDSSQVVTAQEPAPTDAPVEEETTVAAQPTTTSKGPLDGVVDPIESVISSILGPDTPVVNATEIIPNPDPTPTDTPQTVTPQEPSPTDPPTENTDVPQTNDPSPTVTPQDPSPTDPPPTVTPQEPEPTDPTVTPQEPGPTGEPEPPTDTTVPPPDTTTSGDPGITPAPGGAGNTTVSEPPPDTTSSEPLPPPAADTTTFTSVPVAATVTGKEAWLGTKLAADDATATGDAELPAPTNSEELPAGMPKTIDASDDDVTQPAGTTLIRIVFDRRLHYEFVAENFTAAQQIFTFLPMVISYGEGVDETDVRMLRLVPIETKQKKGWITTAAMAYVPTSIIDALQIDIHLTNSALYHHPSALAYELASAIDPSYGIFPGSEGEVTNGENSGPGGSPFTNGEDSSTTEEQTPSQKGATVGIAFGAVSVAVAYGAAMFLVARRYKRKKQAHRRASSVTEVTSSDMRYSGSGSPAGAMMGGALLSRDFSSYGGVAGGRESHGSGRSGAGNSARTAYISAPVAAENSLGWN